MWILLIWMPTFQSNTNSSIFRWIYIALPERRSMHAYTCWHQRGKATGCAVLHATVHHIHQKKSIWNITLTLWGDNKESLKTSTYTIWGFTSSRIRLHGKTALKSKDPHFSFWHICFELLLYLGLSALQSYMAESLLGKIPICSLIPPLLSIILETLRQ